MHLEGATFAQIAAQVGWANRGTAHTAVMAEYRARIDEDVKEKRAQALLEADLIRVGLCDVLQSTKSDSVKVRALGKLLDASKHIAKLQGLVDHVPKPTGTPMIFDTEAFQLRGANTCRLNDDRECGFDPALHPPECRQPLAGEVMDPEMQGRWREQEKAPGPAAQTQGLDHRPDSDSVFLV
jgi:hypothetical protein